MEASVPLAQAVPAGLLLDPKGAAWISSAPIVRTSAAGGELPAIPEELWAIVLEQCDAVSLSRLMAVSWPLRELLLLRSDQLWVQLESADGPPVPPGLRRRLLPRQLVIWQRVLGGLQAQAVALNVAYDKVIKAAAAQTHTPNHRSFGSRSAVRLPLPSCRASARALRRSDGAACRAGDRAADPEHLRRVEVRSRRRQLPAARAAAARGAIAARTLH